MAEKVKINPQSIDQSKILAIFCLVMGIVSIPTGFVVFGAVVGIIGIIFGIWHWRRGSPGRVMAACGIGLSIVGIAVSCFMFSLYIWMIGEMQESYRESQKSYDRWIGVKAPDFAMTGLDGNKLTLSQLEGKRVVLDFWATWCPPCKEEMPHFIQLKHEYGDQIAIVGISHEEVETQKKFAEEYGVNFTLATVDQLPVPFSGIRSIPTTFYIDSKGVIQHYSVGYHGYDSIKQNAIQNDYQGEVLTEPRPEKPETEEP